MIHRQKKFIVKPSSLLLALAFSCVIPAALADADGCMLRMAIPPQATGMMLAANITAAPQEQASLYKRLGGYDAISAVVDDVVQRLAEDKQLGRFWAHRGMDGLKREKQLIVDFIVNQAGGPLHYGGREMKASHVGMRITQEDWKIFMGHLDLTLQKFNVPSQEKADVVNFMESLKDDIIEKNAHG